MAALVIGFALVTALCTGYQFGRRAGSRAPVSQRPSWQQRTSMLALGKAATSLLVLVALRRMHRSYGRRGLPIPVGTPKRRTRRR